MVKVPSGLIMRVPILSEFMVFGGDLPIPQLRSLLLMGSPIIGVSWVVPILTYSFMQHTLLLLQLPALDIKKNINTIIL